LTEGDTSDTFEGMTTISIKELHGRTGHWLRRVSEEGEVIVTERGKPIARLLPAVEAAKTNPFLRRRLMPGVARLMERPLGGPLSTEIISEGRNGR
jgi:prevent-host-death family protein